MADDQQTEEREEPQQSGDGERGGAAERAREKEDAWQQASEKIRKLGEEDEPPTDLKDWPDDEAKYITYGGGEGDHGYDEGPEKKLGPSSLERHEDGSISIEGEKVDNPDDYKGEPIPGGPTDPNAPKLAGEEKKEEKQERQEDDGS